MRKIFIFIVLFSQLTAFGSVQDNIAGKWAESISERVIMEITPDKNFYNIFITWREDNLAQKDIYKFRAKKDKNGNLKYKNGVHIYRFFDKDNRFEDKIDYTDGSGVMKIYNNKLIWSDYKDNSDSVFIKTDLYNDYPLKDRYNLSKDYFDYSVVLTEFPKDYFYTTVKIAKSKNRILIITDNKNDALFYYFAKNGFVYPLGYLKSETPFRISKNYLYMKDKNDDIKFFMSDKKLEIKKIKSGKIRETLKNIDFVTIQSAERFAGDFGEPAGDDVVRAEIDGFYFDYHRPQYKKKYIKTLMRECIKDGVKTNVQMYCCMVKKLHP